MYLKLGLWIILFGYIIEIWCIIVNMIMNEVDGGKFCVIWFVGLENEVNEFVLLILMDKYFWL